MIRGNEVVNQTNPIELAEFARWRSSMYLAASSAFEKEPTLERIDELIALSQAPVERAQEGPLER